MPECMYVDFGAYGIRAITIPFYATASEMQVKYMVSDAKLRYIFVGEQYSTTQLTASSKSSSQCGSSSSSTAPCRRTCKTT